MHKVEVRSEVWMAYEDDWFGKPWSIPETVVMVHGNCESSRAWSPWVPHLAGQYRVVRLDLPGFGASSEPPSYGWSPAALGASSARIGMDLEAGLWRIRAPTLIVTTQESGLQSVEEVARYAARIPDARVIVLTGDSFHIAAVEPDLCAQHALRFMQEVSA